MSNNYHYSSVEMSSQSLKEITEHYNMIATKLGTKTVKGFRDKPTAIGRALKIQSEQQDFDVSQAARPSNMTNVLACPSSRAAKPETKAPETKLVKLVAGPVATKEGTAHNMLRGIVGKGLMCDKAAAKFIEAYKATYKGVKTVDLGFAKGYIAGAIRRGHLVIAK